MRECDWTVSIIAQQDGEHLFEYVDLEQSILNQRYEERIRFVIFYYEQESGRSCIKELQHRQTTGINYFKIIREWKDEDIYDKQTLVTFFQQYVIKDVLSYRNLVLFWGHGSGMGYFSRLERDITRSNFLDRIDYIELNESEKRVFNSDLNTMAFLQSQISPPIDGEGYTEKLAGFFYNKYYAGVSLDSGFKFDAINAIKQLFNDHLRLLSVKDIATIFKASFKDRKINVLITLNCYTQTIETCLELRNSVELLVAPQTTMPFAGWDYFELFKYLYSTNFDSKELAKNMKCGYKRKYTTEPFATQFLQRWPDFPLDRVSFSAINLGGIEPLAKLIDAISLNFLTSMTTLVGNDFNGEQIIRGARDRCEDVTVTNDYDIIDLTHFLEECVGFINESNSDISILFEEFKLLKDKYVETHLRPSSIDSFTPAGDLLSSESPNFLSIFFPYRKGRDTDFAQFFLTQFYNNNSISACEFLKYNWDEIINHPLILRL